MKYKVGINRGFEFREIDLLFRRLEVLKLFEQIEILYHKYFIFNGIFYWEKNININYFTRIEEINEA